MKKLLLMVVANLCGPRVVKSQVRLSCVFGLGLLCACQQVNNSAKQSGQPGREIAQMSSPLASRSGDRYTRLDLWEALSNESLMQHVGQQVVVIGFWSGFSGDGTYIYGGRTGLHPDVYVRSTRKEGIAKEDALANNGKVGALIQATGTLEFDPGVPGSSESQGVPTEFYMDVEGVTADFPDQ